MLHDPSHVPAVPTEEPILLTQNEKEILKGLGQQIADIAKLPVHKEKAQLWTKLNDLKQERPMVWINEIPWHEMNVNDELTVQTTHPFARQLETSLRRTIYQWNHMPADMVINNYIECPIIYHTTDFGILEDVDTVHTDANNDIYSRHFKIQINEPEDIEKIKIPKITYMEKATEYSLEAMKDIFKDIIDVKKVGQSHIWFTPWDFLIRWWGVEEALMDLYERPEMVHEAYDRMVDAWMCELDQFDSMGLLERDDNNTRIGSGGYGYTNDLPKIQEDGIVHPINMWGCSNAQIFSGVSPEMHWEFALEHDMRWLKRFGLTYYGCCEPLHHKLEILSRIPNLRKISVSAWADVKRIVNEAGSKYVLSRKPSPSIFVGDFDISEARKQIEEVQSITKGCNVEYIMKDISTVGYKPERLWEWEKMIMSVVQK